MVTNTEVNMVHPEFHLEEMYSDSQWIDLMQGSTLVLVVSAFVFIVSELWSCSPKFKLVGHSLHIILIGLGIAGIIWAVVKIKEKSTRDFEYKEYHSIIGYISLTLLGLHFILSLILITACWKKETTWAKRFKLYYKISGFLVYSAVLTTATISLIYYEKYPIEGIIFLVAVLVLGPLSVMLLSSSPKEIPTEKKQGTEGLLKTNGTIRRSARQPKKLFYF